jgi:hypothetical protein
MSGKSVLVSWTAPEFGQIRTYSVWRAVGAFLSPQSIYTNRLLFMNIGKVTATTDISAGTTFLDSTVKNNTTYTYFLVDTNKQGVQSAGSTPVKITVKF